MKRLKSAILAALVGVIVYFGFTFAPIVTLAEENGEFDSEISISTQNSATDEEVIGETDSVENENVFEQKTYVWEENENKLELTLLNETTAEGKLYVYGTYSATVIFSYTYIESDVIELCFPDESYFESYRLHPNGYLIEYDDGVYIPPDIDDSEEEIEEIPMDEPTEEEDSNAILLPVVSGIVGLVGAGLLYLLFSGRLDKLKKAFGDIVSWFTEKKEELATEEIDLKKFKEDLTKAVSSNEEVKALLQQAYESNKEQYLAFKQAIENTVTTSVEMVASMKENFEAKTAEMQKQYDQIREILIKMAAGSAELVHKGIADDIVKSLEKKKG